MRKRCCNVQKDHSPRAIDGNNVYLKKKKNVQCHRHPGHRAIRYIATAAVTRLNDTKIK